MEEGMSNERKEGTVEISKSSLWMIISGVVFVLLIISVFTAGFGIVKNDTPTGLAGGQLYPSPSPSAAPPSDDGIAFVEAKELVDNDPVLGDKDAPLTIVDFSDFQCPFCGRFEAETFGQIKKEYIDTGKVKWVYRDFPLSFHQNAQKAAEAAECANEQGKFWEYHGKLYATQSIWSNTDGISNFKSYASELGLNADKFNTCLDSGKYKSEVEADAVDGSRAGVSGTPSFVVGKKLVVGAQPFSAFKQAIDSELGN